MKYEIEWGLKTCQTNLILKYFCMTYNYIHKDRTSCSCIIHIIFIVYFTQGNSKHMDTYSEPGRAGIKTLKPKKFRVNTTENRKWLYIPIYMIYHYSYITCQQIPILGFCKSAKQHVLTILHINQISSPQRNIKLKWKIWCSLRPNPQHTWLVAYNQDKTPVLGNLSYVAWLIFVWYASLGVLLGGQTAR